MASILPYRSNTNNSANNAAAPPSSSRHKISSSSSSTSSSRHERDASSSHITAANMGPAAGVMPDNLSADRSNRSTMILHKPHIRPQYPADSEEKHVEYILVASFDIDRGSVMEHQYPAPIGGDEHMLAELMLPDQAHVRSQDWTIFFLHKDANDPEEIEERRAARRRAVRRQKRARAKRLSAARRSNGTSRDGSKSSGKHVQTKDDDDEDEEDEDRDEDDPDVLEDEALESIEGPPLVYVLNLVNTKQDNTVKRGAVVKAMAICTRHSFLHIYKPLLLLALEDYFRAPLPETLASLYDAVNQMDLSLLPRLSLQERFILQASDVKDLFIEKFETMVQQRILDDRTKSQSSQKPPSRQRHTLPRDTHEFESVVNYNNIPVPIKIPTALSAETVGDFSLIKLIQTFSSPHANSPQPFQYHHPHLTTSGPLTHPIVVLVNALLTQKRVIFIGHNLPSSDVAEAVLAACALASGGLLRGFTRHAFPYTDLTKIDDLLNVPGFIAGVTNPTFTHKSEWWDLLCDLPTGRMKISPKVENAPVTEGMLFFQQAGPGVSAQNGLPNTAGVPGSASGASSYPLSPSGVGDLAGDNAFMTGVLASIADRRGEAAVRAKFRLWITKFIRLATAFEEMVYGASALSIHFPPASSPTAGVHSPSPVTPFDAPELDPAVTGHGYVWPSTDAKIRELAANSTRIEGWRSTRSYYNFVQDFAVLYTLRPIQDLDLQHLHDKLTKLRLGSDNSAAIYVAICARINTYEQINQLLGVLVNISPSSGSATALSSVGDGGLFYLALGLFHPRTDVREMVAALLSKIRAHEAGRHFWNKLGRFEKAAWERVVVAKQERELA
ncbi:hypothetical protein AAFC00_001831 [Neodothiora populina]|uniref:UDENN domain-containing protein n=1 Tax=Neodothiora populina TaxID=2781224 RepID=A0ABR3PQ99_9PEZI